MSTFAFNAADNFYTEKKRSYAINIEWVGWNERYESICVDVTSKGCDTITNSQREIETEWHGNSCFYAQFSVFRCLICTLGKLISAFLFATASISFNIYIVSIHVLIVIKKNRDKNDVEKSHYQIRVDANKCH